MPYPYDKLGLGSAEYSTLELARRHAEMRRNYTSITEQAAQALAANRRGYEGMVEQATAALRAARRDYDIIHGEAIKSVRQAHSSITEQLASIRPKTGSQETLDAIRLRQDNEGAIQSILRMDRQLRRWSDVTRLEGFAGLIERAQSSWDVATRALLARAQELTLWDRNPVIGARLASIPATYASFCESTERQLSLARETHLKNALSGSILLAERHLLGSIDTITPFIPLLPGPPRSLPTVPLRLYIVQKEELEASETLDYSDDPEELAQHSSAAISSDNVSLMLHLIHQVNETARLNGREDVFKFTNKMFEAVIDLNGMVPTNKLVFGHFVDCLYWIFYEGAGKDNLRFHTGQGGPLSNEECAVIWDIKTIRNKLCRHDQEHGDKSSVKGSYRKLSETLASLSLRQIPHKSDHYRMIHRLLIEKLVDFLSGLLQKLGGQS